MKKSYRPRLCCQCEYWKQLPNPEMGSCFYEDDIEPGEVRKEPRCHDTTWYNSRCLIGFSTEVKMPENFKWLMVKGEIKCLEEQE